MNPDQIISLAPNPATLQRAQTLAHARNWTELRQSEGFLWGSCKGSGSKAYLVTVDKSDYASQCNCPARVFPCKHALGLILLYTDAPAVFPASTPPERVKNWQEKRRPKTRQAKKNVTPSPVADERLQKRIHRMQLGMQELETWLQDILHMGLAELSQQDYAYFEAVAARLTDAQAPGLANLIRALPGSMIGDGWQQRCLHQIGHVYLLLKAFQKLGQWPPDFQEELKTLAGINVKKDSLQAKAGITDIWEVVGKRTESQDRLEIQRLWLWGHNSRQFALLLDFSFGGGSFTYNYMPGTALVGELVFYPGILPQRAHLKLPVKLQTGEGVLSRGSSFLAFLKIYAEALSISPFLSSYPAWLSGVFAFSKGEEVLLISDDGKRIPLHPGFQRSWEILAVSGGEPLSIFGEWSANQLLPLGILTANYRWINLS